MTAIPTVVAPSGMALACTPPRLDGQPARDRVVQPGATTARPGWDLEGVAFHEDIPGHHLQLSRIQVLEELPATGRLPWRCGNESLLDALATSLMRAARLVVDTELYALRWRGRNALD